MLGFLHQHNALGPLTNRLHAVIARPLVHLYSAALILASWCGPTGRLVTTEHLTRTRLDRVRKVRLPSPSRMTRASSLLRSRRTDESFARNDGARVSTDGHW